VVLGDQMGVAGGLNDNADIPADLFIQTKCIWFYNMAGNVSEWVLDVYRPNTPMDADDFSPFRGNVFDTYTTLEDFTLEEKDSTGKLVKREVTQAELANKNINYRGANVINYVMETVQA
jgi:sulfatase modifying factor 1